MDKVCDATRSICSAGRGEHTRQYVLCVQFDEMFTAINLLRQQTRLIHLAAEMPPTIGHSLRLTCGTWDPQRCRQRSPLGDFLPARSECSVDAGYHWVVDMPYSLDSKTTKASSPIDTAR